jgi:hypothetical protein
MTIAANLLGHFGQFNGDCLGFFLELRQHQLDIGFVIGEQLPFHPAFAGFSEGIEDRPAQEPSVCSAP